MSTYFTSPALRREGEFIRKIPHDGGLGRRHHSLTEAAATSALWQIVKHVNKPPFIIAIVMGANIRLLPAPDCHRRERTSTDEREGESS